MADFDRGLSNSGHSIFAPSAAHRWMPCAGSLWPSIDAADMAGEDAAYGTVAHSVAEYILRNDLTRKTAEGQLLGQKHRAKAGGVDYHFEVDAIMLGFVFQYVDWCRELDGDHFVETKVWFSDYTPIPSGGTADHAACEPGHLTITDLKMGIGVMVFAEWNAQAMLYALGFVLHTWEKYEFETVLIRIAQPRLDHFDEWQITVSELMQWAEHELRPAARRAWEKDAPRSPSQVACRFCPIAATCVARLMQIEAMVDESFDMHEEDPDLESSLSTGEFTVTDAEMRKRLELEVTSSTDQLPALVRFRDPLQMPTAMLVKIRRHRRAFEQYLKMVHDELEKRVKGGEDAPGMKLVEGRTKRKFRSEKDAIDALAEGGLTEFDAYVMKLVSPAQVEKKLQVAGYKKKEAEILIADYVLKLPGPQQLVFEDDEREAEMALADESFDEHEEEL